MQKIDRGAIYDIYYTEVGSVVVALRKFFTWPFDVRAAARELNEAHEVLVQRYHQLEAAKAQVQQQAEELEASYRARQSLQEEFSRRLIEQQEASRKRLASEMHDGLGQNLLVVNNELQQYLREQQNPHDGIRRVASLVQESVETVREISSNLHPHHLERLGFLAAVDALAQTISHSTAISIECSFDPIVDHLPKESEIHLYRIIQEALANIARHAHAARATVEVKKAADAIEIVIYDDGCGFTSRTDGEGRSDAQFQLRTDGFGLASMRERARIIGARFTIESTAGLGTKIHLSLPLT
jgi:signal transduction histidine kinase